jgi:hypothetical protein
VACTTQLLIEMGGHGFPPWAAMTSQSQPWGRRPESSAPDFPLSVLWLPHSIFSSCFQFLTIKKNASKKTVL